MSKKKILLGLGILLLLIQVIRIDKTNPPVIAEQDLIHSMNANAEVSHILKIACYDCHSNESKYPWYTNVAPISWWVKNHINKGRGSLNFSEWQTFTDAKKAHGIEESIIKIEKKWMPISSYKWMHADARLSDEQRNLLINWFKSIQ